MYEFRTDDAFSFAGFTGIEAKQRGNELFLKTCPYCRPGNTKGNLNTFSINLDTGQFKCLRASCGVSGNMLTLAKDFGFSLGEADEYMAPKKKYRQLKTPKEPVQPKDMALKYLQSRGLSEKVAREYEITVRNDHENILVFPFYDENGVLAFVKYRKTDFDPLKDKNKEWCEKDCKPILFGMKQCRDFKRLTVTEGQLDSLSVAEAGINNAVSVPTGARGFTWVPYCWDWVNRFEEILVFGDFEKGKVTLLDDFRQRFRKKISFIPEKYYKGCKDANEILQKYGREAVAEAIDHAQQIPVKRVLSLSDVKNVSIHDIPKLKTGIGCLDSLLVGGLPFGQVHVISGRRGDGKSTLAGQLLVNALEQNYRIFAYSGELPNHIFKNWMDLQIAGAGNICRNENLSGAASFYITDSVSEQISSWYREKAWLFDTTVVEEDEVTDLPALMEQTVMQYGVQVILVDNLMTAVELDGTGNMEKYERQGCLVHRLVRLALKYNVLILLVAHRRKNSYTRDANDEVSGTGDITNYAGVVMSYDRDSELDDTQRRLVVSKNRLTGKINREGFVMDYEERSRRIYGFGDDVNRQLEWKQEAYEFAQTEEETPFD